MANGGIIGPVVTPPNVQTQSAPGVWTIQEAQEYIRQGLWPRRYDPLYNYTTLLLSGNGANNATNSSFLDSSSNNFTITRNGNTTQGTFSPFSQTGWGNYFDGTGDYLSVADNSVLRLGTSNFTIECWVNRAANGTAHSILAKGGASTGWLLEVTSGNVLQFTHTTTTITTSLPVYAGNWVHVAAVREGTGSNQFKLYINGTLAQTATMATDFTQTDTLYIGANRSAATTMNGYISNVRIVNGTALYTAQFTPSTTPLTTTSQGATAAQVELLTCQSNRFLDNSGNGFTVTPAGNSSVVAFSPFNATRPWDPLTYGGGGYFDGSGDYLSVADNAALNIGTADYQISCWIYPTAFNSTNFIVAKGSSNITFYYDSSGFLIVAQYGIATIATASQALVLNQWSYITVSRVSNVTKIFINSTEVASASDTSNYTSSTALGVGQDPLNSAQRITGYLTNFRLVKGSGVTSVTVPTSPLTAITNTSLLLNFTNIGITDATSKNTLETVGDAKISTAQSKFGGSSMYFDGTGDYLTLSSNNLVSLGTADFTVEFWVNYASAIAYSTVIVSTWFIEFSNTRGLVFYDGATGYTRAYTVATSQWYHVAVSKQGTNLRFFVDGVQQGATVTSYTYNITNASTLEVGRGQGGLYPVNGYIQDLRITKGVARYTENFAVPDSAFATLGNTPPSVDPYFDYTTLLLPGSGSNNATNNSFLDSSANNFTITRNGNTTQGTFSPFSQTGWGNYFDGSGDYLSVADNAAFTLGSGDFTVEVWVYKTTTGTQRFISAQAGSSGSNASASYTLQVNASEKVVGSVNSGATNYAATSSGDCPLNAWTHIVLARDGNTLRLYINGVQDGTASVTGVTINDSSDILGIGSLGAYTSLYWPGYLSNFRLVKGTCVYPNGTTFTPPTAPLTAISGTSLLTCQSNRFIDNSTNNFTITVNGNTSVVAFSPFNPSASWSAATYGGSGYFDPTGDYLSVADNAALRIGTQDFWIEAWVFVTSYSAANHIINKRVYNNIGTGTWSFSINTSGAVVFNEVQTGAAIITTNNNAVPLNTWTHVAVSRDSSDVWRIFINGTSSGTTAPTNNFDFSTTQPVIIGNVNDSNNWSFKGYMSNLRFGIGSPNYTSNFVPPTSPLTAITNTSLLLNFTNAGIYDATSKNDLETVGDAKISTAQSVWTAYGSSMSFDGTGDWLTVIDQPVLRFGTGNLTIEMWLYLNATGAARGLVGKGDASNGWLVSLNSSNNVVFTYGTSTITSTGTISASVWTNITVVREGTSTNQTKIYINGTNDGTGTVSTDFTQTNTMYVGANRTGGDALNGYLQDLRITRWARYTSNFQPPSAPLALR